MSKVLYNINFTAEGSPTSLFFMLPGGTQATIPASHPHFEALITAVKEGDVETIESLTDAADRYRDLAEIMADIALEQAGFKPIDPSTITVDRYGRIYYDGEEADPAVSGIIERMWSDAETDTAPLTAFVERVKANPEEGSRKQMMEWLTNGQFSLTDKGRILAYRYVKADGLSSHSGSEDVTVTFPDGTVAVVRGRIPNPIGGTVEMDRDLVTYDPSVACSVGLHVGTWNYIQGYGDLLLIEVDPADVVSIPRDSGKQKMRVAKYRILRRIAEKVHDRLVRQIDPEPEEVDVDEVLDHDAVEVISVSYPDDSDGLPLADTDSLLQGVLDSLNDTFTDDDVEDLGLLGRGACPLSEETEEQNSGRRRSWRHWLA